MDTTTSTTEAAATRVATVLRGWDRGTWCLAALALASRSGAADALVVAARDVVAAAGLTDDVLSASPFAAADLDGMASAPLLKAAALVGDRPPTWSDHDDDTLRAQGRGSGSAAALFARVVLVDHPELAVVLDGPGARMLDVGTGVGALAVGFARRFPRLHVTGIDVLPRALDLARTTVADAGLTDRIALLRQDVADLDEESGYDLAWLPAPFVPESALRAGVARIARALRPGGVLLVGHGRFDGSEIDNALTRFETLTLGGTPLPAADAVALLEDVGLRRVRTVATPPGAPGVTLGVRP